MLSIAKPGHARTKRNEGRIASIAGSPLFDSVAYAARIAGLDPRDAAAHYFQTGWREGRDPGPYFRTGWYLDTYPDIRAAGVCPLSHFLEHGLAEGRSTSPFFETGRLARSMSSAPFAGHPLLAYLGDWQRLPRPDILLFDIDFFLEGLPADIRASGREPFAAFMADGARCGWDPHPLFSTRFYLDQNPEVDAAGINPLVHYVVEGASRLRDPHPSFDSRFYRSQLSPEEAAEIGLPLVHYLRVGAQRGLDPNEAFSTTGYLSLHGDVRSSRLNPLVHFVTCGQREGRPTLLSRRRPPPGGGAAARCGSAVSPVPAGETWRPLSVIIPTFNRLPVLRDTLEACERHRGGVPLEYVIVDDGSTDGTSDYLAGLSFAESPVVPVRTPNRGPGPARNAGARIASHDLLLLMGDDIRPENDDFFRAHSRFHQRRPGLGETLLGKVVWPASRLLPLTFVMAHVQGRGGEQFAFASMTPHGRYDFRHFYTANVSIKKALVDDWETEGFSADFSSYGFEDTEFAYRIGRTVKDFSVHYDPASVGLHIHPHTAATFTRRQLSAGRMAKVFATKHREAVDLLGLGDVRRALDSSEAATDLPAADHLAMFEGLRAWINLLDLRGLLGTSGYHDDLLSAFFELAFRVGYIEADPASDPNKAEALHLVLDRFLQRMRRSISHEIADGFPCLV